MCLVLFHFGTHFRGFWETLGLTGVGGQWMKGGEGPHPLPTRSTVLTTFYFLVLAWAKGYHPYPCLPRSPHYMGPTNF